MTLSPDPASRLAFALGALGLLLVLVQLAAGPFAPQPSLETFVGETAAGIREAAARALAGEPAPPPEARPWDVDRLLRLAGAVAGGLALALAALGLLRGERRRAVAAGAALGAAAVTVQLVVWVALLICGVLLLGLILEHLGDILG
jgi:hypothetical protein